VKWDIDRDGKLDAALHDCRRLASFLADQYSLDPDELLIGFSGSKGFYIELPVGWAIEPSPDANLTCRSFAERTAHHIGVTIDAGIYDRVRLFRAWNSRHAKTGRYKVRIDLDDLLVSSPVSIISRATEPIPFDPSVPALSPSLASDWATAERDIRRLVEERHARRTGPVGASLNALTRELIVEPEAVEVGNRHRRLFSAAANLAEFETIDHLIRAILTEPGLNTGLPPREVERQIQTGIEHARRQRCEGGAG
jgi:hypothetical protein